MYYLRFFMFREVEFLFFYVYSRPFDGILLPLSFFDRINSYYIKYVNTPSIGGVTSLGKDHGRGKSN